MRGQRKRSTKLTCRLDAPEGSISDAVCAIIYAAPRTELKELQVLREILMHRVGERHELADVQYGRAFALSLQQSDPPPASVPPRILSKLAVYRPPAELVDAYLQEIARGYGVSYMPPLRGDEEGVIADDVVDDAEGQGSDGDDGGNVKESEPIAVPAEKERSDSNAVAATPPTVSTTPRQTIVVKKPTEDDELAARFERLKNLR